MSRRSASHSATTLDFVDVGCYLSLGKSFSNTKARAEDEMSCALRVVMGGHCVASQWHPLRCVFVNHLIFILQ